MTRVGGRHRLIQTVGDFFIQCLDDVWLTIWRVSYLGAVSLFVAVWYAKFSSLLAFSATKQRREISTLAMTVQVHVYVLLRFLLVLRWQYYEVLDVDWSCKSAGANQWDCLCYQCLWEWVVQLTRFEFACLSVESSRGCFQTWRRPPKQMMFFIKYRVQSEKDNQVSLSQLIPQSINIQNLP